MPRSLVFLSFLLLMLAAEAQACSCGRRSIEQKLAEANYVFVARVVSTREIASRADHPDRGGVQATFTLVREVKGRAQSLLTVQSGYGSGDCGVPLLVGTTYLFFAGKDGELSICSGTQAYVTGYEPHERLLRQLEGAPTPTK